MTASAPRMTSAVLLTPERSSFFVLIPVMPCSVAGLREIAVTLNAYLYARGLIRKGAFPISA